MISIIATCSLKGAHRVRNVLIQQFPAPTWSFKTSEEVLRKNVNAKQKRGNELKNAYYGEIAVLPLIGVKRGDLRLAIASPDTVEEHVGHSLHYRL